MPLPPPEVPSRSPAVQKRPKVSAGSLAAPGCGDGAYAPAPRGPYISETCVSSTNPSRPLASFTRRNPYPLADVSAHTLAMVLRVPMIVEVESGLAYTSLSCSTTAGTCGEAHDCASDRWAPDELPGDEEDDVLAQASAETKANIPIHLMAKSSGGETKSTVYDAQEYGAWPSLISGAARGLARQRPPLGLPCRSGAAADAGTGKPRLRISA